MIIDTAWSLYSTHIQSDRSDGADFLLRQRAEQSSDHSFPARRLARREDAGPVVYVHLDLFAFVRRQTDVNIGIDRLADHGRGALVRYETDQAGHGVFVAQRSVRQAGESWCS